MRVTNASYAVGIITTLLAYLFGDGNFISIAIGAALFLVGLCINLRSWGNASRWETMKRPFAGSLILVASMIVAFICSTGLGFVSDVATGFVGTGLMMVPVLIFMHLGRGNSRSSK